MILVFIVSHCSLNFFLSLHKLVLTLFYQKISLLEKYKLKTAIYILYIHTYVH